MTAKRGENPAVNAAWKRFRAEQSARLDTWIEAERALAEARMNGADDFDAGDRLLAAEAALQTAIIDFAAAASGDENPTPLALEILRLAEALLDATRSERVARARELREPRTPPVRVRRAPAPPRPPRPR